MCGTLTAMNGLPLRAQSTRRFGAVALTAVGLTAVLAGCSTPTASTADNTTSPSATKVSKSATPSPTSASPTYTRKATPSPTKVLAPLFVASLPDSVSASVGQRIVVQLPTEPNERWSASGSGGVTVSGTKFVAPPEGQPDAPGTSITTVTAKKAGAATVTFTSLSTNGPANSTKRLTVAVK